MSCQEYIEKIVMGASEIIDKVGIKTQEEIKPLNIEDIHWHFTADHRQINPIFLYNLLATNVKSLKVYRRPYFGVISDSIPIMKSLSLISKTLSIPTLILGKTDLQTDTKLFKMVDYGLLALKRIEDYKSLSDFKVIPWFEIEIYYKKMGENIIFLSEYIEAVAIILYLIRPILSILYRNPFLLLPLKELRVASEDHIIYLDRNGGITNLYEELRYVGIKIRNGYLVEDLYAYPMG